MNRLVLVPTLSPRRNIGLGLASMVLAAVASSVTTARRQSRRRACEEIAGNHQVSA